RSFLVVLGVSSERLAQFVLRFLQNPLPVFRQVLPGPVFVECQHRHGRTERLRLPPFRPFRRALQRQRNPPWIIRLEDMFFQIHGVALFGNLGGPLLLGLRHTSLQTSIEDHWVLLNSTSRWAGCSLMRAAEFFDRAACPPTAMR